MLITKTIQVAFYFIFFPCMCITRKEQRLLFHRLEQGSHGSLCILKSDGKKVEAFQLLLLKPYDNKQTEF